MDGCCYVVICKCWRPHYCPWGNAHLTKLGCLEFCFFLFSLWLARTWLFTCIGLYIGTLFFISYAIIRIRMMDRYSWNVIRILLYFIWRIRLALHVIKSLSRIFIAAIYIGSYNSTSMLNGNNIIKVNWILVILWTHVARKNRFRFGIMLVSIIQGLRILIVIIIWILIT